MSRYYRRDDYDIDIRLPVPKDDEFELLQADRVIRLVPVEPDPLTWIEDAIKTLNASSIIGRRSLPLGSHVNYGNNDRLIREGRKILGIGGDDAD